MSTKLARREFLLVLSTVGLMRSGWPAAQRQTPRKAMHGADILHSGRVRNVAPEIRRAAEGETERRISDATGRLAAWYGLLAQLSK